MNTFLDFKDARCKDCYKCLRECPVKAIEVAEHHAQVMPNRCILCGHCTMVCPQNAKVVHSERVKIADYLKGTQTVIASVAPSFVSSFGFKSFLLMKNALKRLGFSDAEETAEAAAIVTREYERLLSERNFKNFITSCCPAVNRMIQIYFPEALPYLAPVDSPMLAHARMIKSKNPNAKIIFIGPCIAKKREAEESGIIDGVLTFEELSEMFAENSVSLNSQDTAEFEKSDDTVNKARFYPISRGVIKSFSHYPDGYECVAVDGIHRCVDVLANIGALDGMMLEMNACEYSCVNGPCSMLPSGSAVKANGEIRNYAQKAGVNPQTECEKFNITRAHGILKVNEYTPTESEITEILKKIGKYSKEDELNCGACGYSSCREKAWAVANGYTAAEICLPYMRERAESMSYEIIQNSPNGIILLDNDFNIVEINSKAVELFGITEKNVKGKKAFDLFNPVDFIIAANEGKNKEVKIVIDKTGKTVELSIILLQSHDVLFGIMKDITEETKSNEQLKTLKIKTLSTTDEVIKKQMRVAQEIASLLGETTAETKVALLNLKKILTAGGEE